MATPVSNTPAPAYQPLPHKEHTRPLADFAPRFKAAAEAAPNTAATVAHTAAPLPAAPMMPRTVAREAQRPAAMPTPPAGAPAARPMETRGAVPERLAGLLQAAHGRNALATAHIAARPAHANAAEPAARHEPARRAAATPAPAEAPVRLNTLARQATEPARTRPTTAVADQEIRQASARQSFQAEIQHRTVREEGGTGARKVARAILDQRA